RDLDEYAADTRASLAARELLAEGINVHPGERIGYVIADAKAKEKADRVRTSTRAGAAKYDREEYAKRLEDAAKEIGVAAPSLSRT
ncbi:MAG: hypothetical protein SF339_16850, partial [Blastocatellia bacterium]|nr:hypothetical protein [Blastocatellia bacterium]